ncbi:hypothetical protein WMW72_35280 [Paenibacillus filicis]|uniref:Uncharacterized protein n=1 Tax=Paenibacillus filicis TaxID=669464 RepID=A0ABU9DYD1_9BACL
MESNRWRWEENADAAVKSMRESFGDIPFMVDRVSVVAGGSISSMGFHELSFDVTIGGESRFGLRERMPISWFKRWGIIKRWDSFKRSEDFLNSDLGREWFAYYLFENKEYFKRPKAPETNE